MRSFLANSAKYPFSMAATMWRRRELIRHFAWREFVGRYRGAHLGVVLSLASPIILLVIYTVVFGSIFRGSFSGPDGEVPFSLALFSALTFFNLFSDAVARAATLLSENPNFITKVVFPLEILPVAVVGNAFLHYCVNVSILLLGILLFTHTIPWTVLLLPLLLVPVLLFALGICWILSALGIYFRDLAALVPPLLMALTFLSAIFYPVSRIPEQFQIYFLANPMVGFSEMARAIFVFGIPPHWGIWAYCTGVGIATAVLGHFIFTRLRKGFSDAL
jgi:lipopolysaccharide transport system permease protein